MLDGIEDQSTLTTMESNFRKILKRHTTKLLETKRIYWKTRFKVRSVKLDDENTDFFNAMATQSYRKKITLPLSLEMMEYKIRIMIIKLQSSGNPTKIDWENP